MRRPAEIRTAAAAWIPVLRHAYAFLQEAGVGDLLLYGSQAMSMYMERPLRSKDIDLVSTQIRPALLDELTKLLAPLSDTSPTHTVLTRQIRDRLARTYSIYLKLRGSPLVLEIFDTVLNGKDPAVLGPYVHPVSKWGFEFLVPTPEAVVALRLSFRPPERISRLNAVRLNRLMAHLADSLAFRTVTKLLDTWETHQLVRENLSELYRRHRIRILHDKRVDPQIEAHLGVSEKAPKASRWREVP